MTERGRSTTPGQRHDPSPDESPRLLSESLRILGERGLNLTLDGDFGRDLEEIIRSHEEPLNPPAWD